MPEGDVPTLQRRADETAKLMAGHAPITLEVTKEAVRRIRRTLSRDEGEGLTRSACGPFLGLAPYLSGNAVYSREAALSCLNFNDSVISYIERSPWIETVILASALSLYRQNLNLVRRNDVDENSNEQDFAKAANETVNRLHVLGKKVVLVASPPYAGFNIGSCLERRAQGLLSFGAFGDCKFSIEQANLASAPELHLLNQLSVGKIGFSDFLCPTGRCETLMAGKLLYMDGAHLTYEGAEFIGRAMHFPELVVSTAR